MKADVPHFTDGRPVPDGVLREHEQEFFSELAVKLKRGAREGEAALTPLECEVLLGLVRNRPAPKHPRGRPAKDADWIGLCCLIYEVLHGAPIKVAVERTMKSYGVSRAAVYAARQKLSSK